MDPASVPTEENAAAPLRQLRVQGRVLAHDGVSWVPVRRGVLVLSLAGRPRVPQAQTATREDGSFELVEDVREEGAESDISRGIVAVDHDGSRSSYPVYIGMERRGSTAPWVVLRLRATVSVHGRVVSPGGQPVPQAECRVRWLLPAGTHLRGEDVDAVVPQYLSFAADGEGHYSFSVPPGKVEIAARAPTTRAIGRRYVSLAELPELHLPDVVVGTEEVDVAFAVQNAEGLPIQDAWLVVPRELLLHVSYSAPSNTEMEGCLRSSSDGVVRLSGVDRETRPFSVAIVAPGYVPRIVEAGARFTAAPVPIVLREKARAAVQLLAPGGSIPAELNVNWLADRIGDAFEAPTEEGGAEAEYLREYVRVILPDVELVTARDGTECTVYACEPGRYRVTAGVAGGVVVAGDCVLSHSPGPAVGLTLPPGRAISLRLGSASLQADSCLWRLCVRGYSSPPGPEDGMPEGLMRIRVWSPTPESPAVTFWCPAPVQVLGIRGANRMDLPVQPVLAPLPAPEDSVMEVDLSPAGCGWLRCRYESPTGVPRGGVELKVVPLGLPTDRPSGRSEIWTGEGGVATIALPPGEYYVSRSRRYGPAESSRHWVAAGTITDVVLVD